jgi:hypothetical protein
MLKVNHIHRSKKIQINKKKKSSNQSQFKIMSTSCPPCLPSESGERCKEPSSDEIKQLLLEILEIIGMLAAFYLAFISLFSFCRKKFANRQKAKNRSRSLSRRPNFSQSRSRSRNRDISDSNSSGSFIHHILQLTASLINLQGSLAIQPNFHGQQDNDNV